MLGAGRMRTPSFLVRPTIETLVASGIEVEANSKNAMLTRITEDTIMLAKSNTFGYLSGLEVQGVANMAKGPPCLLPLNILGRYIAKTIDHSKSSSIRRRITLHNLAHASLRPVFSKMIAAIN